MNRLWFPGHQPKPDLLGESLGWWLAENEAIEAPAGNL